MGCLDVHTSQIPTSGIPLTWHESLGQAEKCFNTRNPDCRGAGSRISNRREQTWKYVFTACQNRAVTRGYPPLDLGSEKAPPDEAHTGSRFSLGLYSGACAPGNVFRHGHGHIRGALTSPLGLLLRPGGSAPVRTCKLQSSVMAGKNATERGNSARRDS